jgi:hypothetical protein
MQIMLNINIKVKATTKGVGTIAEIYKGVG